MIGQYYDLAFLVDGAQEFCAVNFYLTSLVLALSPITLNPIENQYMWLIVSNFEQ